ncbi:MAG: LemA family protein [Acidovorax sp.]|uniref:LemA family protein n=1 Tax=Acidovorax sp. TaxID=1872122 RepID=UPI0025BD351C|nr:LemA family protein [Acidovorax sp.]MCE1192062.1 LemA family protein [Acidovorax sp.]
MWSSPLFWIAFSLAVFWALGAYNRLMRLRSAVVQAFGSFDAHMVRWLALLGEFAAAQEVRVPSSPAASVPEMAALQGAATQLTASLAMARARPLQPEAVAALIAARDVLVACWHKGVQALAVLQVAEEGDDAQEIAETGNAEIAEEAEAAGSAREAAPPPAQRLAQWRVRWDDHAQQADQAARVFNSAVVQYNAAIAQFPASLLARVFGFKAARSL